MYIYNLKSVFSCNATAKLGTVKEIRPLDTCPVINMWQILPK